MTEQIPPVEEQINPEHDSEAQQGLPTNYKIPKFEIPPETQKDIDNLSAELKFRESPLNEEINKAQAKKDTGGEKTSFQAPVVEMPKNRSNRSFLRKVSNFTLGLLSLGAVKATAEVKNPGDSLKNKPTTDKVVNLSDSLETKYTGNEAVDDVLRQDWNEFQTWLAEKGMAGKTELDKGGLGYKLFDEYCKTHKTSLNREKLTLIREELLKLRAHIITNVRAGKEAFSAGTNEENLMRPIIKNEVTGDRNYPGSNFTKFRFPGSTTITYEQATINHNKIATDAIKSKLQEKITDVTQKDFKVIKTENNGFVKAEKNRNPIANSDFVKNDTKNIPNNKK